MAIGRCTYCGAPGNTQDHVPARANRRFLAETEPGRYPELTVPACQECNSLLRTAGHTVSDRRHKIKQLLRVRYARILLAPDWTEQELLALGPTLQQSVRVQIAETAKLRSRLAW